MTCPERIDRDPIRVETDRAGDRTALVIGERVRLMRNIGWLCESDACPKGSVEI